MAKEAVGYIILTGVVEEEDGQFVSYCRELGTASCGDTISEALENLGEAIELNIEGLEEVGELERTLREYHIRIDRNPPKQDGVDVNVPLGQLIKIYSVPVPLVASAV
jgi:predicted RNase H-like HicB family nuclease